MGVLMPTSCKTCEKEVPPKYTEGRKIVLPWCITHHRWFAECQCRVELALMPDPVAPTLPQGVVDFMKERAKRKGKDGTC
jgi:hypothetical protein